MNEILEKLRSQVTDVLYLAFHQHGNVNKHVVQLLDATLQTDNVFVSGFNFTQGLFGDARVHDLRRGGGILVLLISATSKKTSSCQHKLSQTEVLSLGYI